MVHIILRIPTLTNNFFSDLQAILNFDWFFEAQLKNTILLLIIQSRLELPTSTAMHLLQYLLVLGILLNQNDDSIKI